ncbi:MAG: hypothetical protein ACLS3Z_07070 [Faecalibacterium sp.]
MIQVCDPPRQRQVRRLSAEEFFYIGALRRGGVLPSPLRGAADADRRRGVGHSRGSAAGATPLPPIPPPQRHCATGWDVGSWRAAACSPRR